MDNQNSQGSRFTKATSIILVLTFILSGLFIILGIIQLNNNNNTTYKTYWVYSNSMKNLSVDKNTYCQLKYEPDMGTTYYLNFDGAYIYEIKTENGGTVSYTARNTSTYDYSYYAYLSPYYTYTIVIYTKSSNVNCYIYC